MPNVRNFVIASTNADPRAQQVIELATTAAKSVKSTFNRQVWKDGFRLRIVGATQSFDENELSALLRNNPSASAADLAKSLRTYPVFKTKLISADGSESDYELLWLKTLIFSVTDAEGNEHTPQGTFNTLVQSTHASAGSDDEALNTIFNQVKDKVIKCRRTKPLKEDYFTRTRTVKLCEFDIEG